MKKNSKLVKEIVKDFSSTFTKRKESEVKTEAEKRKSTPVFSGVVKYFPDALCAVAQCSMAGNEQYNLGKSLHWDRSKSGDELDACMRHLMEAGTVDSDGIRHSTKSAWRALANLQKELEQAGLAPLSPHNKVAK